MKLHDSKPTINDNSPNGSSSSPKNLPKTSPEQNFPSSQLKDTSNVHSKMENSDKLHHLNKGEIRELKKHDEGPLMSTSMQGSTPSPLAGEHKGHLQKGSFIKT